MWGRHQVMRKRDGTRPPPAPADIRRLMRRSTLKLALVVAFAASLPVFVRAADGGAPSVRFDLKLPAGIPFDIWSYYVPGDNPITADKVKLGERLFFDKRLSADGSVSCASCHDPRLAFADGRRVAEGISGKRGTRNTPSLLNSMFNTGQFWDGRAQSLEEQAKMPLVNPDEMGSQTHEQVVARVNALPEYSGPFADAFARAATIDLIVKAIASYERTLVSGDSPLDKYMAGDVKALSDSARNGMILFRGRARCSVCHTFNQSFPFLTDGNYRNTGVAANFSGFESLTRRAIALSRDDSKGALDALVKQGGSYELGRFLFTGNSLDIGAYRTPSLRNVELTAPYFHDGSAATLQDVVRFYVKGGNANPMRDWQLEAVDLTEDEQRDLVEFLKSLTSDEARRASRIP
jgi:cytochrome c peroxidase